ncbi:aconitase X catalytic domain-containing protein [Pseudomonas sp. GD03651]|uniref:aconitase X n=1 Tax=Pseudomonas TaxID=286 RepID=UPI00062A1347|nr:MULTISPECIES: aconitase X catalytic domain-containing protein [Pseudomonas]MBI6919468.1 aconitase X catalytic domain-containing protein [Pseudomonas monteilii]MBM3112305.1 aconitase X catalytic domain-containing protein [Pseudomonas arcuscaelestis]MCE0939398.1 aconitase X catalytic domain-containing protein [Pseudomonas kurunegalensis]MCE0974153.1 aconitase X catalytic domain-containing protein [Pseudomonas putida]MCZ9640936.1 aconitase X catalytic domain-containing protein [Pseudomonas put
MKLSDEEQAMLAGEMGEAKRWAIEHMQRVGRMFDAVDLVPVSQSHMMGDPESLGVAGVEFLERMAEGPGEESRVVIPMITDPRGVDLSYYKELGQTESMANLERRAIAACQQMGIMMTDTCINYQTIMGPIRGDHVAFGDTGVVIYTNSVLGARSNFEGGPSALAAGLTGRTPRYGLHLDEKRRATKRFVVRDQPIGLTDWGVLGGLIGRMSGSYWEVPVVEGLEMIPTSDQLKHFGAAMASFGSTPLFHIVGITPEAPTLASVCDRTLPAVEITQNDLNGLRNDFGNRGDKVDVVVFAAPQLSLVEMGQVAALVEGKRIHKDTAFLVCTSPSVATDCDRMGITARIEASGAKVLRGTCFYQQYARELAEANGWTNLLSNSAKIVNIISGYGYKPSLRSMEECVESAIKGVIV